MQIKRSFKEDGVLLKTLLELFLDKELEEIIDNEIFNVEEEGNLRGIENDK